MPSGERPGATDGTAETGVELRFPPVPDHVRTARLVAATVARRAGLDSVRLEELRLAVGEACARAVRRCTAAGHPGPVLLRIDDGGPGLTVEVADGVPGDSPDERVALALIRGLADEVKVLEGGVLSETSVEGIELVEGVGPAGGIGGRVRLSWWPPLSSPGPGPLPPGRIGHG